MESYKEEYNKTLKRYYDGCNYLSEHPEDWDKYISKIKDFGKRLDEIALQHPEMTENEILNGFGE